MAINIKDWLNVRFQSSTTLTKEFSNFARKFKAYVKRLCHSDFELVKWSRGHFDVSGFLKNTKTNKLVYFGISDVRHFHGHWYNNVLIRTAEHERDYTGGHNNYTTLPNIIEKARTLTT